MSSLRSNVQARVNAELEAAKKEVAAEAEKLDRLRQRNGRLRSKLREGRKQVGESAAAKEQIKTTRRRPPANDDAVMTPVRHAMVANHVVRRQRRNYKRAKVCCVFWGLLHHRCHLWDLWLRRNRPRQRLQNKRWCKILPQQKVLAESLLHLDRICRRPWRQWQQGCPSL